MVILEPERAWLWSVLVRSGTWGVAIASVGLAGTTHVMSRAAGGGIGPPILLATLLLAFGVGAWAGAPDAEAENPKIRERWLSAAALAAVAASFAAFSTVYEQIHPGIPWTIGDVLLTVGLPFYGLGLLAPVLVTWAERALPTEDEVRGPWSIAGPVAGGALFGGMLGFLATGLFLLPRSGAGPVLMTSAVILLLPLLLRDPARAGPRESLIFERTTPFGSLRVLEVIYPADRQPERRLYLNDEEESAELVRTGTPTLGYIAAAESWLSAITPPAARYLFLGGGAYTLPRRIAERDARAGIDVVELDPEVTRIAYHFFGLSPHHRIRSVHGDARAYLQQEGEPFDRIYVDVYGGSEKLPFSLVTREAAERMAAWLRPGGVLAMNVIGKVTGEEALQVWSVVRTFADVFPSLALYIHLGRDFADRQNLLLAAAPEEGRPFPASAGHFERWPREEWPSFEDALIFRDLGPPSEPAESTQLLTPPSGRKRA